MRKILFCLDPFQVPPPEILDIPTKLTIPINSQVTLQCKCRSLQKPATIKWFKKKDKVSIDQQSSYQSFIETSRSIKYFENFYEPMVSSGIKELNDNVYLSKLTVNEIMQNSTFVCVAINYFGYSFRESTIEVMEFENDYEQERVEVFDFPEKNYKILFLIPVVLLLPISMLTFVIIYLLINRQILKRNKNPASFCM